MIKPFTVVYQENANAKNKSFFMMDVSRGQAMITAKELLPSGSIIKTCFHDPSWGD